VPAQIEVDVQLVASQSPALCGLCHQGDDPCIHHGDLAVWVAVGLQPSIADQTGGAVQAHFGWSLAPVFGRATGDQLDPSLFGR